MAKPKAIPTFSLSIVTTSTYHFSTYPLAGPIGLGAPSGPARDRLGTTLTERHSTLAGPRQARNTVRVMGAAHRCYRAQVLKRNAESGVVGHRVTAADSRAAPQPTVARRPCAHNGQGHCRDPAQNRSRGRRRATSQAGKGSTGRRPTLLRGRHQTQQWHRPRPGLGRG